MGDDLRELADVRWELVGFSETEAIALNYGLEESRKLAVLRTRLWGSVNVRNGNIWRWLFLEDRGVFS
jgi:hypothetical protein